MYDLISSISFYSRRDTANSASRNGGSAIYNSLATSTPSRS